MYPSPELPQRHTRFLLTAATLLTTVLSLGVQAADPLPRSTPEAQGVSSSAVAEFVSALDTEVSHVHGLMVLRNGHVIAEGWWEPYRPEYVHLLHSLSKSFTSTAIGMAIEEGILSLDDKVHSFFPGQVPESPSWNQENMRIRDLLSMSTGHEGEDLRTLSLQAGGPIVEPFLHLPVDHKPGTLFLYNTPATYMCSAILQKVTGEKLIDYLRPRLFEPLGIDQAHWATSSEGITVGGWGLSVNTDAIARFGQLYLQDGLWEGQRLLSADWVRAATSRQTSTGSDPNGDWDQGYGYQFWRSRHESYRGDGAFGQFALVLPKQNSVVAIHSGTSQMQDIMNITWDRLLPEMQDEPLAEDPEGYRHLTQQLEDLSIPIPISDGKATEREKQMGQTWTFTENPFDFESLSLAKEGDNTVLTITTPTGTHEIRSSPKRWIAGETDLFPAISRMGGRPGAQRIAASETWTGSSAVSIRIEYTEAPHMTTMDVQFSDQEIAVEVTHGNFFGPGENPKFIGKLDEA